MTETPVPPEAVRAAMQTPGGYVPPRHVVERLLAAAAPAIREQGAAAERARAFRVLMERHKPVADEWGQHCGTCWARGGSRPAWPCAEAFAIADALGEPGTPSPVRGDGDG